MNKKIYLWFEFTSVFILLPIFLFLFNVPLNRLVIPILLIFSGIAFVILKRDKQFSIKKLYVIKEIHLKGIFVRWLFGIILLFFITYIIDPNLLFQLLKTNFKIWLMVIVLYPLLSVYPQELLYRSYFFHRYRELFTNDTTMILASGFSFGLVHIIFQNWIAPILSFAGGLMFAKTYAKENKLISTVIEHAIWGDLIFTIGLGYYFYSGNSI